MLRPLRSSDHLSIAKHTALDSRLTHFMVGWFKETNHNREDSQMGSHCDIFISYRRLDSAIFSQWLATQLRSAYGQDCVFIDTENIRDAAAWAHQVESSLKSSSLIIIVVGKSWLSISDEFGRRRIDLPDDWGSS